MSLAEDAKAEVPDWPERRGCYWLVEERYTERYRPCGNTGSYHIGPDLAFCHVHEDKFMRAILCELEENTQFRERLIRQISALERQDTALWAEHRKDIREWPVVPGRAHCVYFAHRDGFVKIGRTSNVKKRMHDIGKGSCMPQGMSVGPVRLLAVIYCSCTGKKCERERHFHDRFRAKWLEGEWFLFDDGMAAFIGGLRDCLDDSLREVGDAPPAA